jgi:hypothetical protein
MPLNKFSIRISLLAAMVLLAHASALPQEKPALRFLENLRNETQLSLNFFTGPDAADFAPSLNGFGSGLLDPFGLRSSIDLVSYGTEKVYLSLGAGFSVYKYRLAKNLVFGKTAEGNLTWEADPDESHYYPDTFFGYGKSKIITTSFFFPASLHIDLGKQFTLSAGGYMDVNFTARYKMKYLQDAAKIKEIIRSDEFRKYNPSLVKFGVDASLYIKKIGYGISAAYCLTPFFRPGTGPEIHETRVSLSYTIKPLKEITREE